MSNTAAPATSPTLAPPRSFWRTMWHQVVVRWGARVGFTWIGILAFCAVFAPFLANSHPLALKLNGVWSSPLLQYLNPQDYILPLALFAALALWAIRALRPGQKVLIFLAWVAAVTILALIFVKPPLTVVYDQYRVAARAGQVERAIHVPIPFSPDDRQRDIPDARQQEPSRIHWMGTTDSGADLAANMIYGTRIALSIGFIATGIAVTIGVTIGSMMGYFGGLVDLLGMRVVEVFQSIPTLLLLLTFVAFFEPNLYVMMAIIGFTSWVGYATFVRAEVLKLRKQDFVHAAVAAGLPLRSVLFRHILPNAVTPVLVTASFGVAVAILSEATLSFLGIGLVSEASWGKLLNQALSAGGAFYWWIAIYPGLAIFLTVFAYNMIGEAFRDALDPRILKRE